MDPRLLQNYNRELLHLREMAAEFAATYPGVAPRLGLERERPDACDDPYVERLLEGVAFLTARIQLEIDKECPELTQHLLELVYPQFLAPTPSMAVVRLEPKLSEGNLEEGVVIPRGTPLRTGRTRLLTTPCEYRTAHELRLWPLAVQGVEYWSSSAHVRDELPVTEGRELRAGLRVTLRNTLGTSVGRLPLDELVFYLHGQDDRMPRLLEQLLVDTRDVWIRGQDGQGGTIARPARAPDGPAVRMLGLGEDEALLPPFGFDPADKERLRPRKHGAFIGYRLLREYFAFAERFRFVAAQGLREAIAKLGRDTFDLIFLFRRSDPVLARSIDGGLLQLHCTPAINLFPRTADRIHLSDKSHEHQIVPNKTRALDYEVYEVLHVEAHGADKSEVHEFRPLYGWGERHSTGRRSGFYTLRRRASLAPRATRRTRVRDSYLGSEVFLGLVDPEHLPYSSELTQLSVETLCSNRDLPLVMLAERSELGVTMGEPVAHVEFLAGPTRPDGSHLFGDHTWRFVSQLGLNYLSLVDGPDSDLAAPLKSLLSSYCPEDRSAFWRQIDDGIRRVDVAPMIARIPAGERLSFGRGMDIRLTVDESAFEGTGAVTLGFVLDQFFRRYATINSLTRFSLASLQRPEGIRTWPVRVGSRGRG